MNSKNNAYGISDTKLYLFDTKDFTDSTLHRVFKILISRQASEDARSDAAFLIFNLHFIMGTKNIRSSGICCENPKCNFTVWSTPTTQRYDTI
jgi:hypothetical protein